MLHFDQADRRLLHELQKDLARPVEEIADAIGLSRNAVGRRIRKMEEDGVLRGRVALVDPEVVNLGLSVFISIKTDQHGADWAARFAKVTRSLPEILGVYRTSGEQDYLIRARVSDVKAYDRLYQRIIELIDLKDVSASFVMEEIKETTALPVL